MKRLLLTAGLILAVLVTCVWAYDARLDRVKLWQDFQMMSGSTFTNRDGNDIAAQLDVLDTIAAADLTKIDGITNGTAAASKALVLGSSKEISVITTLGATNIDAGASGTVGTLDVFPTTASKGKLAFTCTDQTGDTTVTVDADAMGQASTISIPDPGGATADFVLTAGNQTVGGTKTLSSALQTSAGVGAKNGATVAAVEYGGGVIYKTVLTCTATPMTFGDEGGQGQYGGTKIYDFPEGLVCTLGAVIDGSITLTSPAIDAWDGDIALGTAAPTDHQTGLVAADTGRYLQSTATTQAVSKVANVDAITIATGLTESGARWTDGTATAADLFISLLVDDDAAHDNTITGTFTGTVTVTWITAGDK